MKIWNLPTIEVIPFSEIVESHPVALVTSSPAWEAVRDHLNLPIAWQVSIQEATEEHWLALVADLKANIQDLYSPSLYAVGGGLAVDTAKYLAAHLDLPLVCLPTALSVDAFLTWASGVRQEGCVRYLETRPPDRLILDFDIIAAAPAPLRAAGICDVLSIATGCWDWQFAESKGQNPAGMHFIPYVAQAAQAILQGALDCAEAAGRGDPAGLKQLLDCLALEVQLCNQIGHARPEEGSEHYFAYAVENHLGHGLPHGDMVGPGILIMADRQGQNTNPLRRALQACQIPLERIPEAVIAETLSALPAYVRRHNLPYGIAHELETPRDTINA